MAHLTLIYSDIMEGVRTKFSHNVIFMVPDGSAIMACWSCKFLEPTVFEGCKWVTLAVTVTIWPGHRDLMVNKFIVVESLTLLKSIAGKCSMTHKQITCI